MTRSDEKETKFQKGSKRSNSPRLEMRFCLFGELGMERRLKSGKGDSILEFARSRYVQVNHLTSLG